MCSYGINNMIKSLLSVVVPSVLFQLLGTETAVKFDGVMTLLRFSLLAFLIIQIVR